MATIETDIDLEALPNFIDRNILDKKMTAGGMAKIFRIGDMHVTSYIQSLKAKEHPINFEVVEHNGGRGYKHLYLVRDVIQNAINRNLEIKKPHVIEQAEYRQILSQQHGSLLTDIADLQEIKDQLVSEVDMLMGNLTDIAPILEQTKFNLLPKSAIVEKSKTYGDACGVYFLIKDDEIVYIGQSINIASRVASHKDKDFDSMSFVACQKEELDILESLYILAYQPALNGSSAVGPTGTTRPATPITLNKIIQMFNNKELS
jgi:predicted house-cleaning noncanonical NTP pyrophosphatase (MazG superfamily)